MKYISLLLIALLSVSNVWSQSSSSAVTNVYEIKNIDPTQISAQGYYIHNIPVASNNAHAVIKEERWMPATWVVPAIPSTLLQSVGYMRKSPMLQLQIPAMRLKEGRMEQLVSASIEVIDYTEKPILARPTYPANSVLNTGEWYKIGVTQRGIHKIDAAFLNSIGINVSSIDARNIRIYGNGGQTMTELPDDSEPNDLVENSIFVSTTGSSFSSSDYILFYYDGLKKWDYNEGTRSFVHTNNYYTDTGYFFINVDKGPGKRIETISTTGTPTFTFDKFNNYAVIDQDSAHYSTLGKIWWSHRMYTQVPTSLEQQLNIRLPHVVDSARVEYHIGSTAPGSTLNYSVNTSSTESLIAPSTFDEYLKISEKVGAFNTAPLGDIFTFKLKLIPGSNPGVGLVNYVRVNGISNLDFAGLNQLNFRNVGTMTHTDIAAFELKNANSNVQVWDITNKTNPSKIATTLTGTTLQGKFEAGTLREFVAFDGTSYHTPAFSKKINNQNLHGLGYADLIIITPASFIPIAEEIKNIHAINDGTSTHIVDVEHVYNEFSSGAQDIAGIRNFLRMFYDRASSADQVPKNVLFIGLASYDYKNRIPDNTNFVPTYQSQATGHLNIAFCTDDYFVLLDSMERVEYGSSYFDMGVGRLPIKSLDEGYAVVNKIRNYLSPQSFGPWKSVFTFVADDKDPAGHHAHDAERIIAPLTSSSPVYNISKMYADVYPSVTSAAGKLFPKLTSDLNNQIYLGTFFVNYTGHGSPQRLAHENILTIPDIQSWRNIDKLPVIITGTCDFGRFDNPAQQSGGALMFLKPDGGSIASITTTQLVYSSATTSLLREYANSQFSRDIDDDILTMGEAMMQAKNATGGSITNNVKYTILGDPALKLAVPKFTIKTDSLKVLIAENEYVLADTVSALGNYELNGSIRSRDGSIINDFNGVVYVTIYDKPQVINLPEAGSSPSMRNYNVQNNIMFRGQVRAYNGIFKINVLIPKDINYDFGKGKISYYAMNEVVDAAGADTSFTMGGFADYIREDNDPPIVKPFIDDALFEDGGVTGPDPILYVELEDENGINVSGTSIGHDLIAVLDGDWANPFILNNFYFIDSLNNAKGYVYYPMSGLSEGWHEITVRAWDVYNNPGTGTVKFRVAKKDKADISQVYNYPNPITDGYTHFVIQHNLSNIPLDVTIQVFDAAGKEVFTIKDAIPFGANRLEIPWNGHGHNGLGLAPGVYHYRCTIQSEEKIEASAYNKLVLIR